MNGLSVSIEGNQVLVSVPEGCNPSVDPGGADPLTVSFYAVPLGETEPRMLRFTDEEGNVCPFEAPQSFGMWLYNIKNLDPRLYASDGKTWGIQVSQTIFSDGEFDGLNVSGMLGGSPVGMPMFGPKFFFKVTFVEIEAGA